MAIKNTNLVIVSGSIIETPVESKVGSGYYRTKIEVKDEEYGKSQVLEVMSKHASWMNDADAGDFVIVTGSLSGRANDKGFVNMSIWARSVEVVGAAQTASAGRDDDMPY